MDVTYLAALQKMSMEFHDDILDEASEFARVYGFAQVESCHLLLATIDRPDARGFIATRAEQVAIKRTLFTAFNTQKRERLDAKPAFGEPLGAALCEARMRLRTADAAFFAHGGGRPVLKQLFLIVACHAERDAICSMAMSCIARKRLEKLAASKIDGLNGKAEPENADQAATVSSMGRGRSEKASLLRKGGATRTGADMKSSADHQDLSRRPVSKSSQGSVSGSEPVTGHLARDAAEVDTAVNRAFRSLSDAAAQNKIDPVIGRDQEIDRIIRAMLRRNKRSVILHGPAGVGKTAIAEGVALALRAQGVPGDLAERTLYELSLPALVSGARYRGDFEERITKAVDRLGNEGAIAFIDEIHAFMGLGRTRDSGMDAANILKPALARGDIIVIGATTTEELSFLRQDRAIMRRFELIEICEPTIEDMRAILERSGRTYLNHHALRGSEDLFEAVLDISGRLMPGLHFPDKAFDLLDRACVEAMQAGAEEVSGVHVRQAAVQAGMSLPGIPGKADVRRVEQIRMTLIEEGVDAAIVAEMASGLSLPILSPATLKGASGWILVGDLTQARAVTDSLSKAIGRPATRFPAARISGPDALDWLVGSTHGTARGVTGALVEAVETHPDGIAFFEGIENAHPDVIELLSHMVLRGEIRMGSGRILQAGRLRLVLAAGLNKRNSIGFNTKGEIAFPELMKPLLGVSGLSVVALDEGDRHADAAARLLDDLISQLSEAGVTASPHPSLEAILRATLPLWASFVGNMRDSALCGFMLTLAARPDVEAWHIALDPEQAKDATPKLILIDATTMPAASNEVSSMSEC